MILITCGTAIFTLTFIDLQLLADNVSGAKVGLLYRVRKLNVTRKWINRLFGQAQAVWQFFLFPGHV